MHVILPFRSSHRRRLHEPQDISSSRAGTDPPVPTARPDILRIADVRLLPDEEFRELRVSRLSARCHIQNVMDRKDRTGSFRGYLPWNSV